MHCKMIVVAILALSLGFVEARGQAVQDSIFLGNVKLSLGMPQETVIAALGRSYQVANGGEDQSSFLVTPKNVPPFMVIGNVAFTDGKLTSIMKYWSPEDQKKGVEFATSLYGVIDGFVREGRRTCHIDIGQVQDPGYDARAMFIVCGKKQIRIDISRSGQFGESATITEVLNR